MNDIENMTQEDLYKFIEIHQGIKEITRQKDLEMTPSDMRSLYLLTDLYKVSLDAREVIKTFMTIIEGISISTNNIEDFIERFTEYVENEVNIMNGE